MEFVVYGTCDKLIWRSGKHSKNINKIIRQGSPKNTPKRYLLHQHWDLFVLPIKTLVMNFQNIWFHTEFKNILKRDCIGVYKEF